MHLITWPTSYSGEEKILLHLAHETGITVHIRKPYMTDMDFIKYIAVFENVPKERFVIHQHYRIAKNFGFESFHSPTGLRKQHLSDPFMLNRLASTSTHSWQEFNHLDKNYQAAFVSPVYPSISKKGYGVKDQVGMIGRKNNSIKAVALGGLHSGNIKNISQSDFDSFAVCGAIWESNTPLKMALHCHGLALEHNLF